MTYLARYVVLALLTWSAVGLVVAGAAGEVPFRLPEDKRLAVKKAIAEDPGKLPRVIADELSAPEAGVVDALPEEMRLRIDIERFEEVWKQLGTWDKPLLILVVAGSIFEIDGAIAPGKFERDYYEIDVDWSPWGGNLKVSELSTIYLIRKPFRGRDTWQCSFYDKEGARAFTIYVGREVGGAPNAETLAAFNAMWKAFGG